MPDEINDLNIEESDQMSEEVSETLESDDDNQVDDTEDIDSSEELPPDADTEGDEPTDGEPAEWNDWKKQYDLPDDIESEDDLAEKYMAMSKDSGLSNEMQQVDVILKAQGITGGVKALLAGDVQPNTAPPKSEAPPSKPDTFFNQGMFTKQVDNMVANGLIKDEDAATYKSVARFNDQVMNPFMDKVEEVLSGMAQTMVGNRDNINSFLWDKTAKQLKGTGVERTKIEGIMRQHNFNTFDEALHFYAIKYDPSLLQKMQSNAEERGINKGRKKLKRSTAMRKGKGNSPAGTPSFDAKKWANSDGSLNEGAISAIQDLDKRLEIIDRWEKWSTKRK